MKTDDHAATKELLQHHIDSYNYLVDSGLGILIDKLKPIEVVDPSSKSKLSISFRNPKLLPPMKDRSSRTLQAPLLPYECRQAKISYAGKLDADLVLRYKEKEKTHNMSLGHFPIMLKSRLCHLREADPQKLVSYKEEPLEMGGYFVLNGLERVLRLIIMAKRNYALVDTTDHEIYVALTCCFNERFEGLKGAVGTQLIGERAKIILDELHGLSLLTHHQCVEHIGKHFQPVTEGLDNESYFVVGESVLKEFIFVHLDKNDDKFNLLIFMLQKLFSFVDRTSLADSPDALQNQEVLQAGQLIAAYLKVDTLENK